MQQVKNTYTYAEMKHESSYIDIYIYICNIYGMQLDKKKHLHFNCFVFS